MAYLLLRNVRNVLAPAAPSFLAPHVRSKSFCAVSSAVCLRGPIYQDTHKSLFSTFHALNTVAESLVEKPSSPRNTHKGKSTASTTKNARRSNPIHRIRTKDVHLKKFNDALEKGEVLSSEQAFHFIKSCSPQMIGEISSVRNELADHVWQELEKNGVTLEIPLWNTLLSVYIDNRCIEFEPIEFLSKLWETSAAEPNLTTFNLLIRAYAMKADPVGAMKIVDYMLKNETRMTEQTYSWMVQAFAKNGDAKAVEEILKTMRDIGMSPRQMTYGKLIDAYAEKGDIEGINKVIMEMIEQKLYPSSKTYVSMLEHLAHGNNHDLLPTIWEKIQDAEYLADDIRPLILSCVCNGYYEFALTLTENITKNTSGNKNNYYYYIERKLYNLLHYSQKDLDEYLKVSELMEKRMGQQPLTRLRFLLDFFIVKNDYDSAISLLKQLDASKIKVQNFHPILQGASNQKNIPVIIDVLQEMTDMDIPLDYYCSSIITPALGEPGTDEYNMFLSAIKEKENINLPFKTLTGLLKTDNLSITELGQLAKNAPTGDLFSSLVAIKKKIMSDFNAADASKIVTILHARGMRDVTILTFELIRNLETDKEVVEGMHFIRTLMENDVPISSETYTRVLRALRRQGLSDEFFMFVRIMKEHGVEPDVHQYYQMLNMAAMVGNSMAAQFCFNKVKDSKEFSEMRPRLYNWLIKAYGKDSESNRMLPNYLRGNFSESAQKAINLFQEMKGEQLEPNPFTISTVIRSYLQNGDFDGADRMMKEYGEGEKKMTFRVQTDFIRAYITNKDFKAAEQLFDSLKEDSKVTLSQYNEMLRMCELRGDVNRSEELYKDMLENDFWPNGSTYAVRIRTYLAARQPEKCISLIEENIANKNDLRVELFMVVLRHLVPTGNTECVTKMIDLIKEHHGSKVPPHRLNEALILVNIKAGSIEEASHLLPKPEESDEADEQTEPALNPYRKAAKSAHLDGDVEYIENLMQFLKINNLYYQTLDTFYLLALNKMDNVEGIKRLYQERTAEGFQPTEKFMSLLHQIIEVRNLQDFTVANQE